MCERYISRLPLTHPQPGTQPTTQACALDWKSNQGPFDFQAGTQCTESHQPGHPAYFTCEMFIQDFFFCSLFERVS